MESIRAGCCVKESGAGYIIWLKKKLWLVYTFCFLGREPDVHIQDCYTIKCQVRSEAEQQRAFATKPIFSFDQWIIFANFVKTVSWVSDIRRIRLGIRSGTSGNGGVARESLQRFYSKLTGLQWVHIDLEYIYFSASRRYDRGAAEASYLPEQLLCFAGTALKTASVIISDARFCNERAPETAQISRDDAWSKERNRWTMAQKQEYAHFLRNALLRHRGKGVGIGGVTGSSESMRIGWDGRVDA